MPYGYCTVCGNKLSVYNPNRFCFCHSPRPKEDPIGFDIRSTCIQFSLPGSRLHEHLVLVEEGHDTPMYSE